MAFWRYWWSVFKLAWRHSFSATQNIIFAAFLLVGIASKAIPGLSSMTEAVAGWQVAALILAGIVGVRLILAPFWLAQELRDRVETLADALRHATQASPVVRPEPLTDPDPNWIALSAAPFVLPGIKKLRGVADFQPARFLDELLVGGVKNAPLPGRTAGPFGSTARIDREAPHKLTAVGVDWKGHKFFWRWTKEEGGAPSTLSYSAYPSAINGNDQVYRAMFGNNTYFHMAHQAVFVWSLLTEPVFELIESGQLTVWARQDMPTAPFSRVPADSWKHYKVRDWEKGFADASSGKLYSIHVAVSSP
jgi:hypothetical protein